MKSFIIALALSILFIGCAPTKYNKAVFVYVYDFTKYTEANFLFTPEQYLDNDYKSIGWIEIMIYPQTEMYPSIKQGSQYGTDEYDKERKWIYYPISDKEILDSLYNKSIRMGANAFVRLKIEDFVVTYENVYSYGKKASGFAIKRKQ